MDCRTVFSSECTFDLSAKFGEENRACPASSEEIDSEFTYASCECVMDIGTLRFVGNYLCYVLAYMLRIYYLSPTVEHCLVTQPEPRISSALLCGRVTLCQRESVGYDSVASSI
jgi:hypothetical protein